MTDVAQEAGAGGISPALELGIVVRDLDGVTPFYERVLGLEHEHDLTLRSGAVMRRMRHGASTIKLLKYPVDPPQRNHGGGPSTASGLRYWTLPVDRLDTFVARAEHHRAPVVLAPVESRPGVWIAMLEDPEGNWVELLERRDE